MWLVFLVSALTATSNASAQETVLVLPPQEGPVLASPKQQAPEEAAPNLTVASLLPVLNELLIEAVQDLGLQVRRGTTPNTGFQGVDELIPLATNGQWVVTAHLESRESRLVLWVLLVSPRSQVVRLRREPLLPESLPLRVPVLLHELVESSNARGDVPAAVQGPPEVARTRIEQPQSSGRAALALNAVVMGGYVGLSAHRASESEDRRLLYPLLALGAGLGLGASMLVADEWNITEGDAWMLSAGMLWPTSAALLLGRHYEPHRGYRYSYSLGAAALGLSFAGVVVGTGEVSAGDAALAHSGGALGSFLGGATEALVRGGVDAPPTLGMGYGSALGVLAMGALSISVDLSASQVLMLDLGASLGAVGGAALGSPLLLVEDDLSAGRARAWWSGVVAGTLIGAATATLWMREEPLGTSAFAFLPFAGPLLPETPNTPMAYGVGVNGRW